MDFLIFIKYFILLGAMIIINHIIKIKTPTKSDPGNNGKIIGKSPIIIKIIQKNILTKKGNLKSILKNFSNLYSIINI